MSEILRRCLACAQQCLSELFLEDQSMSISQTMMNVSSSCVTHVRQRSPMCCLCVPTMPVQRVTVSSSSNNTFPRGRQTFSCCAV